MTQADIIAEIARIRRDLARIEDQVRGRASGSAATCMGGAKLSVLEVMAHDDHDTAFDAHRLAMAAQHIGLTKRQAGELLSKLYRDGLVDRLCRGLYRINEMGRRCVNLRSQHSQPQPAEEPRCSWHLTAERISHE